MSLSKEDLQQIVDEVQGTMKDACKDAVEEVLEKYGVDVKEPIEVQKDFAYIRVLRKGVASLRKRIYGTLGATASLSILYLAWEALKSSIHKGG